MSTAYPLLDLQSIPSLVLIEDRTTFYARITPEIAKRILENANYEHQRPENKAKKLQLTTAMLDNSFEDISTLVFSVTNGLAKLVNGQHTLSAIDTSGKEYVLPIQVYRRNPEKLYPKIDRGKTRTLTDSIRSYQVDVFMGLSETSTSFVARGVKMILGGYLIKSSGRSPVSEDTILETAKKKYKKSASRFYEMVDGCELSTKLAGQIPMSLFLTLYTNLAEKDFIKVDEFIYGCGSGIGLKKDDPRRLVYTMYAERVRWGASARGRRMTRLEETGTLLGCWEKWYNNEKRERRYSERDINSILSKSPNIAGTNKSYKTKFRD